jgi:hypothetical protein
MIGDDSRAGARVGDVNGDNKVAGRAGGGQHMPRSMRVGRMKVGGGGGQGGEGDMPLNFAQITQKFREVKP